MASSIYWFRNDLRITDNPALKEACSNSDSLLPIYIHQAYMERETRWGFPRVGKQRRAFTQESLQDLRAELMNMGSNLVELNGDCVEVFIKLRAQFNIRIIYCEHIEAPEELDQIATLIKAGFEIRAKWQSSMLDLNSLPFSLEVVPDVFTQFRQQIERHKLRFCPPLDAPIVFPPLPNNCAYVNEFVSLDWETQSKKAKSTAHLTSTLNISSTSADRTNQNSFEGGERKALAHLNQYFKRRLPDTYKKTRNELIGMDYSSKFSPWLATGCCSARTIAKRLSDYELEYGANDGTYWLWFELLLRDYFRFLHFKYGNKLYHSRGLGTQPCNEFNVRKFRHWSTGTTGETLVDAGMRELLLTGYLSNRMRQVVASYWIYNLNCDWRAGAAWFESQLIDYDVYSNQGNWLYIAGKGTDPRGGRQFNVAKQAQDHDPHGTYRKIWLD